MHKPLAIIIIASAILGCGGHAEYVHEPRVEQYEVDYSRPKVRVEYDAYFTWTDYDGVNVKDTIFYWNGTNVGKGKDGVVRILSKISTMKSGTRLLVYPLYPLGSSGVDMLYPWGNPIEGYLKMLDTAGRHGVTLILSHYDHNGELIAPFKNYEAAKVGIETRDNAATDLPEDKRGRESLNR